MESSHPSDNHFAYDERFFGDIFILHPEIRRSSIVTADRELKHAATVPRLAAKILFGMNNFILLISFSIQAIKFHALPRNKKSREK